MIQILLNEPVVFFVLFSALVISLSIHEFAHAYVSTILGDDTAKYLGRVTLDPRAHLDPIGTLLLIVAGFGWGKPVPFNPMNLENPKRDSALIAFAGPASNFILAFLLAVVFRIVGGGNIFLAMQTGAFALKFISYLIFYNLMLGVFNLIPVHPLDGFKVVRGLLPNSLVMQWEQMRQYGVFILLILVFSGAIRLVVLPILAFLSGILGLV